MTVYMKNDIKGLRSLRSDLRRGRQQLQSSYRRLSSGFKVSGGAEDVDAELTNALRSRINRYAAAERMTNRAIMHARAAASGLGEIGEAVERMGKSPTKAQMLVSR